VTVETAGCGSCMLMLGGAELESVASPLLCNLAVPRTEKLVTWYRGSKKREYGVK